MPGYSLKKTILLFLFFLSSYLLSFGQKKVILDTDPSADPDDVGCMAMLHNMASMGECEILGMINSTHYKQSSLSISSINNFYNRRAIPVGDYKGYAEKIEAPKNNYDYHLARVYPKSINSWKEALDGVRLYREILASAEDHSITIVVIGTMHNFYDLLRSPADTYSELEGVDLVEKKVEQVVTMGGNFIEGKGYDRTNWGGAEQLCEYTEWSCLNEERNRMCRYVIENCPSPFMASGWEVGCGDYYEANYGNVMTGQRLKELDSTHILRRSYEYHFMTRRETEDISRHSNDQCALHYAIRGEGPNYKAFGGGKIKLSSRGVCSWEKAAGNQQGFIQKKRHKDSIALEIENLMMYQAPVQELSRPTIPQNVTISKKKISWQAAHDTSPGNWVVGYNVYQNEVQLTTTYGTQLFVEALKLEEGKPIEIRALSASGVESESTWIDLE
ncbi:MAG: hypothetical protein AAF696_17085 [Bacteroidota bacterium]